MAQWDRRLFSWPRHSQRLTQNTWRDLTVSETPIVTHIILQTVNSGSTAQGSAAAAAAAAAAGWRWMTPQTSSAGTTGSCNQSAATSPAQSNQQPVNQLLNFTQVYSKAKWHIGNRGGHENLRWFQIIRYTAYCFRVWNVVLGVPGSLNFIGVM